ncbi:hypothetical protein QBC46DRAFT_360960 [Diplogelasinospora grovesii]|uniref:C2H2-type domain-containing protein n=1 Tax=Diplogelasinospora grovesii TaxID=303347 RepID=A0AAN6S8R0_9PEZI|nr:hypothetical protein QBC46DRAFT_360960 [Diplogelasinospora grovesii]
MASSKEMQQTSRPLTHRPSMSTGSSSGVLAVSRQSHSRTNSHSVPVGSLNATHRVTRRKSMTNTGANIAAVAAALQEASDKAMPLPIATGARRHTMSKNGLSRSAIVGSLPSPPASLPTQKFVRTEEMGSTQGTSAIDDELIEMSGDEGDSAFQKARVRRASDGQPLVKDGRKINRPELRCEKCGKGYKHSSCLTKHLWEHTPEWSYTSKLLISKHQQVQLLEAASVLVAMNNGVSSTPPESARDASSDRDSASPAESGYSDQADRSSADTTPPPQPDAIHTGNPPYRGFSKRYSSGSGFSRSYQSAPSAGSFAGSVPNASSLGAHFRQLSQDQRPTSSGKNATGQDDRDLAAAVELLSCSFGSTPGSRTVHLSADVPPVPPLPAQYLDQAVLTGTSFINSFPSRAPESFTRGEVRRGREDVKMEESGESVMDDDDEDMRSRARSDEDDDGVFGRMEE